MSDAPQSPPTPDGDSDGRKLGWGMILAGWVLALIVLTMFFSGVLESRNNPNRLAVMQDGQLTLLPNQSGHYLTDGQINGYRVTFLVDTGATNVAVPEKVAVRAGLKQGLPIMVGTAAGKVRAYNTRIRRLQIGDFIFSDLRAMIIPDDSDSVLLGMNALEQLRMTQQDGALILQADG